MTTRIPAGQVESVVGRERHATDHYARADSAAQVVSILHSHACWDQPRPLVDCEFSLALDQGIDERMWVLHEDAPVRVAIDKSGRLVPHGTELA